MPAETNTCEHSGEEGREDRQLALGSRATRDASQIQFDVPFELGRISPKK